MLEVSPPTPDNFRPRDIATEIAAFIRRWRSEISPTKNLGLAIDEQRLADFLVRMEGGGLPVTLVAYAVLYCEWQFRLRQATKEDIDRALNEMVLRLADVPTGPFSLPQAQLLVSAIEPALRKQLKGTRIPIVFGVAPHTLIVQDEVRWTYTPLVPTRRGSLPVVGPILAGLVIDELWTRQHGHARQPRVGIELCAILLKRELVRVEYAKWKRNGKAFRLSPREAPGVTQWLASTLYESHQRAVNNGMSAAALLEQCAEEPFGAFGDCIAVELIQTICTLPWNERKADRAA